MDTATSLTQVIVSLAVVLAALGGLSWITHRIRGTAGSGSAAIRIVSATSIGPKEKLVVVDIAGEQLLLGVGAAGINTLHQLQVPIRIENEDAKPPLGTLFSKMIAQQQESER